MIKPRPVFTFGSTDTKNKTDAELIYSLSFCACAIQSNLETPIKIREKITRTAKRYRKTTSFDEMVVTGVRERTIDEVDTKLKDMYSLHLIELLRRLGYKKPDIEHYLRMAPCLQYQNGEEKDFEILEGSV